MDSDKQLDAIRARIDSIDTELLALISERAKCAQEVAEVKLAASQSTDLPPVFYRPEREAQVLRAIQERNRGHSRPIMSPRFFGKSCRAVWLSSSRFQWLILGQRALTRRQRHLNISVSRRCLWARQASTMCFVMLKSVSVITVWCL